MSDARESPHHILAEFERRNGPAVDIDGSEPDVGAEGPRVLSTLISTLVFLGDVVYKFRNPVRLGYLDLSTVEQRREDCEREVRLNRRLSPDVYLGVAEVVLEGQDAEPVVVMRRLPQRLNLAHLITSHVNVESEIQALARILVEFHSEAMRSREFDNDATSEALEARWSTNFTECSPFVGAVLDAHREQLIQRRVRRFLRGRSNLIQQRIDSGNICDGHGDLQAADIFCLPDGPRILDCLEFDDHLRHVDVVDDLSFLLMDLERLGGIASAEQLLETYEEFSGSVIPQSLCDHYRAYHAYVRAKVACLRSEGDHTARGEAQTLQELALAYLERSRVKMILVGGLPGTGKSTLAAALADRLGATVLRTDEIRNELFAKKTTYSIDASYRGGRYASDATDATYREMLARSEVALRLGHSVVLDASWSSSDLREEARSIAERTDSDVVEFQCVLDSTVAARRINMRRQEKGNVSDATVGVAALMGEDADPWPTAHSIETSASPAHVLSLAMRVLRMMARS